MATEAQPTRVTQLAQTISDSVAALQASLAAKGLPNPSVDENAPIDYFPPESLADRNAAIDAATELFNILMDPLDLVKHHSGTTTSIPLQFIAKYGIASLVPASGQISFADLAAKSGQSQELVTRMVRFAMTMFIFKEPQPGFVSHTSSSKLMATSSMREWMLLGTEHFWPAAVKTVEALEKWPGSSEPNETGFSLSKNTDQSIYDIVSSDPALASRFATSMAVFAKRPGFDSSHVTAGYDWASLAGSGPSGRAQVVDVGGARGHIGVALAQKFPNLDVVVQDFPQVVQGAESELPVELRDGCRISFMGHHMFHPQPVSADAYLFRWIFHNWSDKHCVAVLRAHIPVMKPGARIIIMERIMPDPNEDTPLASVSLWEEKDMRSDDLVMASTFNARERSLSEWKHLLTEADPRFVYQGVEQPKGSTLALVTAKWSSS
ncbi:uncharacterized protein PgNI_09345 [Pyricularia grisea]|uniref:O-methyltransferase domain-containing protein n=1 Tax=Pyricularia grisea TaxID=148305 RepID=A0A6P8ASZ6_PYRGI|nr:uncharacterized protein PgNI_09345 [Pyricularia grisea]TLD05233.1 hypothetical protein PgNI_09345 [Pyricularia grisea]